MRDDLDIIIPIFGVENELWRCLQSFCQQTVDCFTAYLVDDGSRDASGLIADSYALNRQQFICMHKPNGWLSSARNAGLCLADGDYNSFVDSDDYVTNDYYEKCVKLVIRSKPDLLMHGHISVSSSNVDISESAYPNHEEHPFLDFLHVSGCQSAWGKVYNRQVIMRMCEGEGYSTKKYGMGKTLSFY
ncbi:hypothetical protein AGMMS49992_27790 [Clostridia bacterium]|nr:hypothetical protein AGMMS49992_27790 [Clostridia bacterium]